MTEKQLEAWSWFCGLHRDRRSGERDRAAAARDQLTEDTQSSGRTAERTGRSRDTAYALRLSALRKLVIYRHMQGIGEHQ